MSKNTTLQNILQNQIRQNFVNDKEAKYQTEMYENSSLK